VSNGVRPLVQNIRDYWFRRRGYYGRRKNTIRIARQAVEKAGQYAYRDRKVKKRAFRAIWIQRINAAVRAEGMTYGVFIHGTKLAGIELDRKVMADLAMNEPAVFSGIIKQGAGCSGESLSIFRNSKKRRGAISRRFFIGFFALGFMQGLLDGQRLKTGQYDERHRGDQGQISGAD
jgi:large subunit ribosomal protein L20